MTETIECRIYNSDNKNVIDHKRPEAVGMSVEISAIRSSMYLDHERLDTDESSIFSTFKSNYNSWNKETYSLSTNNYDSPSFKRIVEMGESAVPSIMKIIKEEPNPLVHALDFIYPGYLKYEGNVSLKDVCFAWTTILTALGKI